MIEECNFEGSPLKTAMTNAKLTGKLYVLTKIDHEINPNYKFWKEAFNFISNKNANCG